MEARLKEIEERLQKASPGTWKVVGHPLLKNRNSRHAYRYVMTADVEIELSPNADNWEGRNKADWDLPWSLRRGSIICEMRDTEKQPQEADFIAHAPDDIRYLLAELKSWRDSRDGIMAENEALALRAQTAESELEQARRERDEWKATAGHEADGLESWKKIAEKAESDLADLRGRMDPVLKCYAVYVEIDEPGYLNEMAENFFRKRGDDCWQAIKAAGEGK